MGDVQVPALKGIDDVVDLIMEDADKKLMISRHLTERGEDFSIRSAKSTQETIREVNTRLRIPAPTTVTPADFFGVDE